MITIDTSWKLIMKILGLTWNELFDTAMLGITLVLFIKLPISSTVDSTLEESIFGRSEPLKGKNERSNKKVIGKRYYGSCPELKEDIKNTENKIFFKREILSLHSTKGKTNYEETRQLFVNNVLIESLDDGTPKYYNSNVLGRYYRKDYFHE